MTMDDIVEFIIKNSDKTEWMDRINKITFPFTSKYSSRFNPRGNCKQLANSEREYYEIAHSPI